MRKNRKSSESQSKFKETSQRGRTRIEKRQLRRWQRKNDDRDSKKKLGQVDLEKNSELEAKFLDTLFLSDSSNAVLHSSDDLITQNADFVAFGL